MNKWNNLWRFTTANFAVTLDWEWEDYPDLSWDETGETQEKVESGEWGVYTFRVRVEFRGREVGIDYLGNSIYADPSEFRDHIGSRGKWGSCFTDMVHTAIRDARRSFSDMPRLRGA